MLTSDRLLSITQKTLDEFNNTVLSDMIRSTIRLARLRNDYNNLWQLQYEMIPFDDEAAKDRIHAELASHYTNNEFKATLYEITKGYMAERKIRLINNDGSINKEESFCIFSINDIEDKISELEKEIERSIPPTGMHSLDLYYAQKRYDHTRSIDSFLIQELKSVLNRIKHRVYDYLSNVEKQLLYGQVNADIFEKNRRYVDQQLAIIAPEALSQFLATYKCLNDLEPETNSQALLSCRRILKSVADKLYPARTDPIMGVDGKPRLLTDELYKARLWQFVTEKVKGSTAGKVVLAQIEDIGNRIDKIYDLASKGVHADVSEVEVNQCVIQTYLLIGDLLRLNDETSAIASTAN